MQSRMTTSLQQLTSRAAVSAPLTISAARFGRQRHTSVPCAYVRGNCGQRFAAGRASQQILEQMLREVAGVQSAGAPRDFELPLALDAADEDDAYVFYADIPGVQRQDLKVQTKDGKLTISGKRERASQPEDKKQRFERRFGKFSRQLRLPEDADCNSIKAKVDNGVLTVRVAKLAKLPGVEDVAIEF